MDWSFITTFSFPKGCRVCTKPSLPENGDGHHEELTDLSHELDACSLWVEAGMWVPADAGTGACWDGHVTATDVGDFGTLLRRLRRDQGLTQEELAERAGISVRTVSDLERGLSQAPYRGTINELAAALQLEPAAREALFRAGSRRRGPRPEPESARPAVALPVELQPLVGRDREMSEILRLLVQRGVRLLTLTGVGGVGKTRLAIRVAHRLRDEFRDGVVFVPLASTHDPALLPEESLHSMNDLLRAHFAGRHTLLVLDNLEHLVASAPFVGELLVTSPQLKVLATSRVPLRLLVEQELPIAPLSCEREGEGTLPQSRYSPAATLFWQRALSVRPDLAMDDGEAEAVATICRRVDGIPLAIELAAARTKILSPRSLATRLDRRLSLLTGGARDAPARHQTMRDTIAWSYDLLSPQEQQLFRQVSVFVGGCTIEAVEAVSAPADVFAGLISLVDHSLLTATGDGRFTMLETVREFGLERLAAQGEEDTVRHRHATYFLSLVQQAAEELIGPSEEEWLLRLEQEHDNLRVVLSWAAERGQPLLGLQVAGLLWRFWYARGYFAEGSRRLSQLLNRVPDESDPEIMGLALYAAGALAHGQSDQVTAIALWERARVYFERQNDEAQIGAVLNGIGIASVDAGYYERADSMLRESLAIRRKLGEPFALATSLNNLANLTRYRGGYREAESLYEESLQNYDRAGVFGSKASTVNNLAMVALELGEIDRAEQLTLESLRLYGQSQNVEHRVRSTVNLADVAAERGELVRAAELYRESLLEEVIDDPASLVGGALGLGQVALEMGDLAGAQDALDEAQRLLGPVDWLAQMNTRLLEGDVALARGNVEAARNAYSVVLEEAQTRSAAYITMQAFDRCGWVLIALGQPEGGLVYCDRARDLHEQTGAAWTRFDAQRRQYWLNKAREELNMEKVP
jgi:predicted ATPase/DNA-binding XRE family transcriptional regulator